MERQVTTREDVATEGMSVQERVIAKRKQWAEEWSAEAKPFEASVMDALSNLGSLYAQERQLFQAKNEATKLRLDIANENMLREMDKGKDGKINGSNQAIREMQSLVFLNSLKGEYEDAVAQSEAMDREYTEVKQQIDLTEKSLSAHLTLIKLATAKIGSLGG